MGIIVGEKSLELKGPLKISPSSKGREYMKKKKFGRGGGGGRCKKGSLIRCKRTHSGRAGAK